jgi:photosystem II stability/assembly factor-like uncharacterized protein
MLKLVAFLIAAIAATAWSQPVDANLLSGLRWRLIGPFRGGRVLPAVGIPGNRNVYYFGAVGGGVWKTTNAGETWFPIFDREHIASIGDLAIAPSDPNIIYVGTGEADLRSDLTFGDGVYKSIDAGKTWTHAGLKDSRHIGRVLVDPRDPRVVFVAALGHAYGPNPERGVFKSSDGGQTWRKVLYKNPDVGAIDLAFESGNASVIYAALYNVRRPPWSTYAPLEGPGSGLYKSIDAGETWRQITRNGLPAADWGRVGLATAPSQPRRVYASIEVKGSEAKEAGGLFRSDDAGATWTRVGTDPRIRGRSWYFSGITVDPHDAGVVYMPNVSLYRSTDAGKTFIAIKGAPGGDDYHTLWIDPNDSARMIFGSDQGAGISVDGGKTWTSWYNQPTAQMYHVTTDNQFPYHVYGAQQDSGTVAIASRGDFGQITFRDWYSVGAGESGAIVPDPADPDIVYGGSTGGELFRFSKRTGQSQDISPWPIRTFDSEISQRKYRFTWTSPLVFSASAGGATRNVPQVLYFGSQFLLKSIDQGMSWREASPDLTGVDPNNTVSSGALSVGNAKARGYGVIYTIAPSPLRAGQIWVGTDTGLIHLTRDGGTTWSNVTPAGLADWSKIGIMDASRLDAATAYAAVDRHRLDDLAPYIFRTHDYGKTWTRITTGIQEPAFVNVVRADPEIKGLLYAGTETGAYVSFDDGDHWQPLQLNLPVCSVRDLVIHGDDLVAATHGRSFWILDDVTPLRQVKAMPATAGVHLFRPATAIRIRSNVNNDTPLPPETPAGENPPDGAVIDYYLRSEAPDEVTLEIYDRAGKLVCKFASNDQPAKPDREVPFPDYWLLPHTALSKEAGMHRWVWNLRYASPPVLQHNYGMAAVAGHNTPVLPGGPLIMPGVYEIRLTVAGRTYRQPLIVKMDPRVKTPIPDLAKQHDLGLKIWQALQDNWQALQRAGASADPALRRINARLASLATVVDSADRAPTAQARTAFAQARRELDALIGK